MGTKIIENPFGGACWNWDPEAETPTYMYVFFWDVLMGNWPNSVQPPNLHIFRLTQVEDDQCLWKYTNPDYGWDVEYGLHADECWLSLRYIIGGNFGYFHHTKAVSPPDEYELFTNFFQNPDGNWAYAGFGSIFWLDSLTEILEGFGLDFSGKTLFEIFATETPEIVIKFCDFLTHTNVKIKLQ